MALTSLPQPEAALPEASPPENATRTVWALAWPAVALNSMQVVNTLLDRFFIGHLTTADLTAHGGATNVMFLMFSLAVALATGATALVSRAYGAGDAGEYRRAGRESLRLAVFGGLLSFGLTVAMAGAAARFVLPANDADAQALMTRFLMAYAIGLPPIFVIQALAGSLRGIGDTKSPMVISGVQIAVHIGLNFLLVNRSHSVFGLTIPGVGLGLVGAGYALAGSAWLAAIGYLVYVGRTPLGRQSALRFPSPDWAARILRIATPAATMSVLRVLSLTAFTLVLKQVPNASAAIAAMSISFAVESIMFMPAFGLSMAAGALVGQSLGMGRPDRAERLGWVAGHHGALVTTVAVLPIFLFAPQVASVLTPGKPLVVAEAATLLRYLCLTEFLFGYAMVMIGAMQGAGDTVRPLWVSITSLWLLRVPLAIVLALPAGFLLGGAVPLPVGLGLGSQGAWIAMAATQGVQGILSILAYRQGAWKSQRV